MASESRQPKMEWVFVEFDCLPMLTTDTAIHSNTQQYKVLYYYTIHSTGLRIASGSVAEEVEGVVVGSLWAKNVLLYPGFSSGILEIIEPGAQP